jgi:hypothetical protein
MTYSIIKYHRTDPVQRKIFLSEIIGKSRQVLPEWVGTALKSEFETWFRLTENALDLITRGDYPLPVAVQQIVYDADVSSHATEIDPELAAVILQVAIFDDVVF